MGTTVLHFACMWERIKHADLLLQYGADPEATNEHGVTPVQMLPRGLTRSVKFEFKEMFDQVRAP